MMKRLGLCGWIIVISCLLVRPTSCLAAQESLPDPAKEPVAVPTFHCIGLYWSPPGGSREREVMIRFRREGETRWQDGLPMRYNPIANTDEDLADYRGSLVNLTPGTTYEIELQLEGTNHSARLIAKTWDETFPVSETINVPGGKETLTITASGRPDGYRVYDGGGAVIDVEHKRDVCITIDASYVIVRNFILKGAGAHDTLKGIIGAIRIDGGHDIVIEDCDISDWGRTNPATGFGFDYDAAVLCRNRDVRRVIIQRCKMHHPFSDTNTWYEPKYPTHPQGPQCISFFNTAGNHVIRYNEMFSDLDHMYNDVVGGGSNASYRGSPSHDSDIYGNIVSHCWDDGLEVEGGNRNVRVWGNYITQCGMMIGNAATSIGPLYVWGNVVERSQWRPDYTGGNFMKMGFAGSEDWMTGHTYIFHNTIFSGDPLVPTGGLGGNRIVKHTISRNNILQVRSSDQRSISAAPENVDNDFDYDLFNGRVPADHEKHGIRGVPIYVAKAGFDGTKKMGIFQLQGTSPGAEAGVVIPNFTPLFIGKAPDMGAHQRGAEPLRFGIAGGK
ncbi:MAG: hypothetical protein ACUVQG_05560 [Thermogutta sp.]